MKNHKWVTAIYSIILLLYAVCSLAMAQVRNGRFWLGFLWALFAIALTGAVNILVCLKRGFPFPISVSLVAVSGVYSLSAVVVNILFGKMRASAFLCIHLVCLGLFAALFLLLFLAGRHIAESDGRTNRKISESRAVLYEYERAKAKLLGIPPGQGGGVPALLDRLLDKLKSANFSAEADTADMDAQLLTLAGQLSAGIDRLGSGSPEAEAEIRSAVEQAESLIALRSARISARNSHI